MISFNADDVYETMLRAEAKRWIESKCSPEDIVTIANMFSDHERAMKIITDEIWKSSEV